MTTRGNAMLMLTLPKDAPPTGRCRINQRDAEYELRPDRLAFRHDGESVWQTRKVLRTLDAAGLEDGRPLTTYLCEGDGSEPAGPPVTTSLVGATKLEVGRQLAHLGRNERRANLARLLSRPCADCAATLYFDPDAHRRAVETFRSLGQTVAYTCAACQSRRPAPHIITADDKD
jgi:hypothetical protein